MQPVYYFAFDTETTDLGDTAEIISLSYQWLAKDLTVLKAGTLYAHPSPGVVVAPGAAAVNGYSEGEWDRRGAVSQEAFRGALSNLLKSPELSRVKPLGHNVAFDLQKLWRIVPDEIIRAALGYHFVDTMVLAIALDDARGVPDGQYNLRALCARYGVPLENAHDALADITASVALYKLLLGFLGGDVAASAPLPAPVSPFLEKNASGDWVFSYGKHKGSNVRHVPPGYRNWVLGNVKLTAEHRGVLESL